jgi:hypothetical protein
MAAWNAMGAAGIGAGTGTRVGQLDALNLGFGVFLSDGQ